MFAADAQLDVRTGLATEVTRHLDQLAYAVLVELGKWVEFINLLVVVVAQEFAGIVAAEAAKEKL